MCLLALPLVQPYPPPGPHQRRLSRRVSSLQAVPKGCVLRVGKSMGSVSLQGRKFSYQRREVAGNVPGYVLWVLWSPSPKGSASAERALA
jgi:hypothetical protein